MPVDAKLLLTDLKRRVRLLEEDLRARAKSVPEIRDELAAEYRKGREAGRIGDDQATWSEGVLTQAAVHWVLATVFVRFLEDNGLIDPLLAGPGERGRTAAEAHAHYFQQSGHGTHGDRQYLHHVFQTVADLPAGRRLFDPAHNPVWTYTVSADAARDLLAFWRRVDPDTGRLAHDFTDPAWGTRFLGDLYQDLSDWAKKTYALLQTPDFVEAFILDRTLEPAIKEFGLEAVRMIDPTSGSGHFLLSGFERILRRWQQKEPGTNERALVQKALDAVYGVDLNPFAVAISRFRLLVAALRASGVRRLAQAPDFRIHVASGDSLLFGARKGQLSMPLGFHMEDAQEANRILSQSYHAVVGNPPYITVKDTALNKTYRTLYRTAHMKYALSVPFIERFWELAVSGEEGRPAGFVGMINANSFMKREFGKKVVEEFFPRVDLTHVIDTAGAYIPGHGTPTVLLFGRNRRPVGEAVRAVMGIKGEPGTPADPAHGQVWTAIMQQADKPGSESEFVSVADTPRSSFCKHPWSIGGGGASDLKEVLEGKMDHILGDVAREIGITSVTGEDEVYVLDLTGVVQRHHLELTRGLVTGDLIRDWSLESMPAVWLYEEDFRVADLARLPKTAHYLWPYRASISKRRRFGTPMLDRGLSWYEWQELYDSKLRIPLSITFAFVATHNHFVLDRGGKVFKQSAPVIKLHPGATEADHLALLGLLNSSITCFWLKQVGHNKGSTVDQKGARQTTAAFENFYEFTSTILQRFPVPAEKPLDLATRLDVLATERQKRLPSALGAHLPMSSADWERRRAEAGRLLREMIALQEELDWRCYRLYSITTDDLTYQDVAGRPLTPPDVQIGERAFEIAMVRRGEKTTWFQRHGSTPITEVPARWPEDYRALVEARITRMEADRNVGLVERPEYKRRWNTESWESQADRALQEWLKTRLEDARYWPEPRLQTTRALADRAERDADFMAVAELYRGHAGFDVPALVKELVESESVPFLPALRYKPSGLRNREVWEQTWEKQRQEDAIDARVERELTRKDKETDQAFAARKAALAKAVKHKEVGDIPRPPKYKSADFQSAVYWRLRGALDVPKERFVSYPHASKENDPSLVVGWAGWTHLQQAQALAGWLTDLTEQEGWPAPRLVPVLAGLAELVPWLKQWHNEVDSAFGERLGDFYETFLNGQLHDHGLTRQDLAAWEPPAVPRGRRKKTA